MISATAAATSPMAITRENHVYHSWRSMSRAALPYQSQVIGGCRRDGDGALQRHRLVCDARSYIVEEGEARRRQRNRQPAAPSPRWTWCRIIRGLRSMASRAREAGGILRIDSLRGTGRSMTVETPVSPGGTE